MTKLLTFTFSCLVTASAGRGHGAGADDVHGVLRRLAEVGLVLTGIKPPVAEAVGEAISGDGTGVGGEWTLTV